MNKASVYNQEGKIIEKMELNPKLFDLPIKPELIHQAAVTLMANKRRVLANTKDRSEVRGGGVKPWRQKGTGRARAGSIRSPLWVGGGVVFGPRTERNFKKMMNKKAKRKALLMSLTDRARESRIIILNDLKLTEIKTKNLQKILEKLPSANKKTLLILSSLNEAIMKSAKNLPKVESDVANNLNLLNILKAEYLIFTKDALKKTEENYLKNQ